MLDPPRGCDTWVVTVGTEACAGAAAAADAEGRWTISVPRRCLGNPAWVAVGEQAVRVVGQPTPLPGPRVPAPAGAPGG